MTYKRLAELAGVSVSTVSKVFSGSSEISKDTAERIVRLAEQYNVSPPRYHKSRNGLRAAIIVPEIISIFYASRATDFAAELERYGVLPSVHISGFDSSRYSEIIDSLIESHIDGIITMTQHHLYKVNMPPIVCMSEIMLKNVDTISSDIESGIFEAIEYLVKLGHTSIGFVGEKNTMYKEVAFRHAAAALGIAVEDRYVFTSDKRFEQIGNEAVDHFLAKRICPTAFICAYDEIALGMHHSFRLHGIRVPADISLIGINDISFASFAETPLTTLRTFSKDMAALAVRLLTEKINDPNNRMFRHTLIKGELIIRDTTAPPRKKAEI